MLTNLNQIFSTLFSKYSDDKNLEIVYWHEIEKSYSQKGRYYHSLTHLENMISELLPFQGEIKDWDVLLFSIFYHDIIYKSTSKDNEEQSALLAKERLSRTSLTPQQIDEIYNQILATKAHVKSLNTDTNYLLDADLSILGKSWEVYEIYSKQVRKEYSIYPDFLYNPGRKKVLQYFLILSEIYKTEPFKKQYEEQARKNIAMEIGLL